MTLTKGQDVEIRGENPILGNSSYKGVVLCCRKDGGYEIGIFFRGRADSVRYRFGSDGRTRRRRGMANMSDTVYRVRGI